MKPRKFTADEDLFIIQACQNLPLKQIAKLLGRSEGTARQRLHCLGYTVPADKVAVFKRMSQWKPKQKSWNAGKKMSEYCTAEFIKKFNRTTWRKGNIPHNTYAHDGVITIRKDKRGVPYKHIRISKGVWLPLHQHVWQQHNGAQPKGMCVAFKDRDTMNCNISNLELITRKENMLRNSVQRFPEEIRKTIHTIGILNRKLNRYEKQANRSERSPL
jgi:hypothetical protein